MCDSWWLLLEHRGGRKPKPSTANSVPTRFLVLKTRFLLLLKWRLARVMVLSFPPLVPTYSGVLKHTHLASRQEKPLFFKAWKDALDSTLSHISKTLAMGHIPPPPPQASLPFSQQTCSTNSILSNKQTRTLFCSSLWPRPNLSPLIHFSKDLSTPWDSISVPSSHPQTNLSLAADLTTLPKILLPK